MKTALVTGGSSYNATHLTQALAAAGISVRVLAAPGSGPEQPGDYDIRYGNLETTPLEGLTSGVDVVYHLAETVFAKDRDTLHATNVSATRRLLESVSRHAENRPVHFVFLSSVAVNYRLTNSYTISKRAAEDAVRAQESLPWTIVRPCLVHGPDGGSPSLRRFRSYLLKNRHAILPDGGHAMKDPVSVTALAAALAKIPGCDEAVGATYTLGGASPLRVRDIARVLLEQARHPTTLVPVPKVFLQVARPFVSPPPFTRHTLAALTENALPSAEDTVIARKHLQLLPSPFTGN